MCRAMEEMRAEAAHDRSIENAITMLDSGILSVEDIAKFSKLTIDEVKELAKKQSV